MARNCSTRNSTESGHGEDAYGEIRIRIEITYVAAGKQERQVRRSFSRAG